MYAKNIEYGKERQTLTIAAYSKETQKTLHETKRKIDGEVMYTWLPLGLQESSWLS